jgi:hypothetical protein
MVIFIQQRTKTCMCVCFCAMHVCVRMWNSYVCDFMSMKKYRKHTLDCYHVSSGCVGRKKGKYKEEKKSR